MTSEVIITEFAIAIISAIGLGIGAFLYKRLELRVAKLASLLQKEKPE